MNTQQYPLPDHMYDSKDWRAGSYSERVEWLHGMYEQEKLMLNAYMRRAEQMEAALRLVQTHMPTPDDTLSRYVANTVRAALGEGYTRGE